MHTVHHDCGQIFEKRVKSAIYAGPVQIFFFNLGGLTAIWKDSNSSNFSALR